MTTGIRAKIRMRTDKAWRNAELIMRQTVQDVIADAQRPTAQGGRMRVDTGFLRNSLATSLNGSTALSGPDGYILVVAGMKVTDTLTAGWTASYAAHREYGARGQSPDYFMRGAAQKFEAFARANVAKVG